MATAQSLQSQYLGFYLTFPQFSVQQLNAAGKWNAYGFVPDRSVTISSVRAYVSAITGTGGTTTCEIQSDSNAAPSGTDLTGGSAQSQITTAKGWYTWSGFTASLTAGSQYWAVFKNTDGTPVTNYPTFQFGAGNATTSNWVPWIGSNSYGWQQRNTSNSGSTWPSQPAAPGAGWRVGYSDGSYDGTPVQASAPSADRVYQTRESGVVFTSPPVALNVSSVAIHMQSIGRPVGQPRARIYTGSTPTLLGTSSPVVSPEAIIVHPHAWSRFFFSPSLVIPASHVIRVTLADDGSSDGPSNCWAGFEITQDSDSNSIALLPFRGTYQKTYYNGSNWTDTTGSFIPVVLGLDLTGEFAAG
jgi:hypothetical protein